MSGYIEKYVDGSYTHTLKIPESWVFVELYEAINIIGGSQPPKSEFHSEFKEGLIRLIQIRDYKSDAHKVYIPLEKAKRFVSPDDVMIGRYGPPIFQILRGLEGAYNVALMKAVPIQGVLDNKYLFHFLNNRDIYNYVDSASDRTAGQSGVNKSHLEKYPVGIPPLAEQKVIADKLDELLAQVESTKARLDAIPAILKSFRQSVLAAAVSGKLTEEWRGANDVALSSWQTVKVGDFVQAIEAGKSLKCIETPPNQNEYGIIKISAVTWGVYDESESKTLPSNDLFIENRRVKVGDLLISRANTMELLGNPVIVHSVTKNLMLSDKVLRLVMEEANKPWVSIFLRSKAGRKEIESRSTGNQMSMRNIGQKALLDIGLPKATESEQAEIVRRVEELFAFADKVEAQVNAAQTRVNNLTQSILAKAFRGELTAEWRAANPDLINGDNSAKALLERIKAERVKLSIKSKPRKTKTKVEANEG
ncbi:restriction endonuclease subunit S [Vibrio sp. T20]|uniref:restriction endonuclease subunit S n=1 Tax=Vibrio sp. T20 TaxID=2588450 RepID=UPI0011B678BF|nr:restriction endonuclease subunit S [Vibrio sp. T20]